MDQAKLESLKILHDQLSEDPKDEEYMLVAQAVKMSIMVLLSADESERVAFSHLVHRISSDIMPKVSEQDIISFTRNGQRYLH